MFVKTLTGDLIPIDSSIALDDDAILSHLCECNAGCHPKWIRFDPSGEDEDNQILGMVLWEKKPFLVNLSDIHVDTHLLRPAILDKMVNRDMLRSLLPHSPDLMRNPHPIVVEHILSRLNQENDPPLLADFKQWIANSADEVMSHPRIEAWWNHFTQDHTHRSELLHSIWKNPHPRAAQFILPFLGERRFMSIFHMCTTPHASVLEHVIRELGDDLMSVESFVANDLEMARDFTWKHSYRIPLHMHDLFLRQCGQSERKNWMDYVRNEDYWMYLTPNPHPYAVEYVLPQLEEMARKGEMMEEKWRVKVVRNSSDEIVRFLLAHPHWLMFPDFVHNANPLATDAQIEYFLTTFGKTYHVERVLSEVRNPALVGWLLDHPHVIDRQLFTYDRLAFLSRIEEVRVE